MAEINETLVISEILSRAKETKTSVGEINTVAAAKMIAGGIMFDDESPVLRERMVALAGILVAAITLLDVRETIDG